MFQTQIHERVAQFLQKHIAAHSSLVVAVSGGSDSVALLYILAALRQKGAIDRVVVAHVNYGLRGDDSDADEALAREHATALACDFRVKQCTGMVLEDPGIEAWARKQRYDFFRDVAQSTGCTFCATGHTLDDQAETVLMRIMRGSGVSGLAGIVPVREDGIIRPLLTTAKSELCAWLELEKIAFRQDGTNRDIRFLRNRIRHHLLPAMEECQPGAVRHLAQLAEAAISNRNIVQAQVHVWIEKNVFFIDGESLKIRKNGLGDAVASEALLTLFKQSGITPDRQHIQLLTDSVGEVGKTFLLPDGWHFEVGHRLYYLEKTFSPYCCEVKIPGEYCCTDDLSTFTAKECDTIPEVLDGGSGTVFVNGDGIGAVCRLRTVRYDDLFIPFGRKKPVRVYDFLAHQGVPKPDRERMKIVVTPDNNPIWLPGIRIDERFRVTPSTKKVIKLQSSGIF